MNEEEKQQDGIFFSKDAIVNAINHAIKENKLKHISDGYHTHEELYEFRKLYNACLFNEWAARFPITNPDGTVAYKYSVHKSLRHHDGELCFGGGWFIVVAMLPTGQISNHYKMKDWDLFQVPEEEKALFEFDGHTGEDVLKRLKDLCK